MKGSDLTVYNSLSRSKEKFVPMEKGKVSVFVCGQTVYDDAHIGHAKTYIDFDVVVRWLRHIGYEVEYVQNITDVDDKIITRAKENGEQPEQLAKRFEERFLEDMDRIGVKESVSQYPRTHDYIDEIKNQIQLLADNGYAYYLGGDVYYDVSKFKDYTKLSGMRIDELEKHRIEPREGKRNVYDFALWKNAKEGEPSWKMDVLIGNKKVQLNGRPGWHIEDTAVTHSIFGPQYDVHGGARELIFPHHTNEVAQAEAAFGKKPFVRYWLHSGILSIRGEKMSKSLKNFISIRDALKEIDPESLRLFVCSAHYRKDVDYSDALVKEAQKNMRYLRASFSMFYNMKSGEESEADDESRVIVGTAEEEFENAMNDDFNTPLAIAALSKAIGELRKIAGAYVTIGKDAKKHAVAKTLELANVLGIFKDEGYKLALSKEQLDLINKREELRKLKKFGDADAIREELRKKHQIGLEDTEYGPVWYKI